MKRLARIAICCGALAGTSGCSETPPIAQTETVARAGSAQLSTLALTALLSQSRVPLRTEEVRTIVDRWIDYQLLAKAAANADSLSDQQLLDQATWAPVANARARKWYERVSKTWPVNIGDPKAMYDAGAILAVRQILLAVPQTAPPIQRAAIRQRIDSLRRALTPKNFAEFARTNSADESSARQGGLLAAWPARRNIMVREFETGVLATKPGAISGLISSQSGVHIVYRQTYAEAAASVAIVAKQLGVQRAESTYFATLDRENDVKVLSDAPKLVRAIAAEFGVSADTTTVLATTRRGDFTAAKMIRWVNAYPVEQNMRAQLANAPDTLVPKIIRDLVRNELFLMQADSAGITLTPEQIAGFRTELRNFVLSAWGTLGVAPRMLPDSVQRLPLAAREQFVARRIDAFIGNMVAKQGLVVQVPLPLRALLRARYPDIAVSGAAIDAALRRAVSARTSFDSTRNASGASATGVSPK